MVIQEASIKDRHARQRHSFGGEWGQAPLLSGTSQLFIPTMQTHHARRRSSVRCGDRHICKQSLCGSTLEVRNRRYTHIVVSSLSKGASTPFPAPPHIPIPIPIPSHPILIPVIITLLILWALT